MGVSKPKLSRNHRAGEKIVMEPYIVTVARPMKLEGQPSPKENRQRVLAFASSPLVALEMAIAECRKIGPFIELLKAVRVQDTIPDVERTADPFLTLWLGLGPETCRRYDIPNDDHLSFFVAASTRDIFWGSLLEDAEERPISLLDNVDALVREHYGEQFADKPDASFLMRVAAWSVANPEWRKRFRKNHGDVLFNKVLVNAKEFATFLKLLPSRIEEEGLRRVLAAAGESNSMRVSRRI